MSHPAIRLALFVTAVATLACAGQPTSPRLPDDRPSLDGTSTPCDSAQTDTTSSSYCRGGYVNPHV